MTIQEFPFIDGSESTPVATHYFTIAELRATTDELSNATKYPDALLEIKRDEAEEDWEAIAHRSFVPRSATCYARAYGEILMLPFRDVRTVVSVTLDGVAVDITSVVINPIIGALVLAGGWPQGILYVSYTHGLDEPQAAVKRVVMLLAKIYALPSSIDPRATAVINTDIGGYRISVADGTGKTGIPDIDAAAARYGDSCPQVG